MKLLSNLVHFSPRLQNPVAHSPSPGQARCPNQTSSARRPVSPVHRRHRSPVGRRSASAPGPRHIVILSSYHRCKPMSSSKLADNLGTPTSLRLSADIAARRRLRRSGPRQPVETERLRSQPPCPSAQAAASLGPREPVILNAPWGCGPPKVMRLERRLWMPCIHRALSASECRNSSDGHGLPLLPCPRIIHANGSWLQVVAGGNRARDRRPSIQAVNPRLDRLSILPRDLSDLAAEQAGPRRRRPQAFITVEHGKVAYRILKLVELADHSPPAECGIRRFNEARSWEPSQIK